VFGRRAKTQLDSQAELQPCHGSDTEAVRAPQAPGSELPDGGATFGPYDVDEAPDDGWIRLDLGSLRLPVPEGGELQVEVDRAGPVRAVHLITGLGQLTLMAFAAPRSGGLWREVAPELVSRLAADGARVGRSAGEWGEEIEAVTEQGVLRFLAVDGPRWMLRGVAVGPAEHAEAVRSPLPLHLPGPLGEQLKAATAELVHATAGSGGGTT
jgi:hypothetical protein